MPTPATSQYLPPQSPEEFEEMCADLLRVLHRSAVKHGRSGQHQKGVDIYAKRRNGTYVGVQCKRKTNWPPTRLTKAELTREVRKALKFRPNLSEYIVATTAPHDEAVQKHARKLTEDHRATGRFEVTIWWWGEITGRLTRS